MQDLYSADPPQEVYVLDHADCTAPTLQHELDHTGHTDHTDQEYLPSLADLDNVFSRNRSYRSYRSYRSSVRGVNNTLLHIPG